MWILLPILMATAALAQPTPSVWFARAGGQGDGQSIASPTGSTALLEESTGPGDLIILLPAEMPLDNGIALKNGQALIGLSSNDEKPVITNTGSEQNGGVGIVLAQNNRVWNLRVENTRASGMFGKDVSGAWIDEVEIEGANISESRSDAELKGLGQLPHGGIIFTTSGHDQDFTNHVIRCKILETRGIGVASLAFDGATSELVMRHTSLAGGSSISRINIGVLTWAEGPSSDTHIEFVNSKVRGRLGRDGRNIVVSANSDANATARIAESHLGEVGQDGLVAMVWVNPATVSVELSHSIVERAGWENIEGAINNLPASDPSRADEASLSIDIVNSVLRDAGAAGGFEDEPPHLKPHNIWLGSMDFARQLDPDSSTPFSRGRVKLRVRNSRIQGASGYGIGFGNTGSDVGLEPDETRFDVRLGGNTISDNGLAEVLISAPEATIDARGNYWGSDQGLLEQRVLLKDNSQFSQIDASEPLTAPINPAK